MSRLPRKVISAASPPAQVDWQKELKDFNQRDYNWLFMLLTGDFPDEKIKDVKDVVLDELKIINGHLLEINSREVRVTLDLIRNERSGNIVHDISWIQKNDQRLLIWLMLELLNDRNLEFIVYMPRKLSDISTENRYKKVIECIDAVMSTSVLASKERWLGRLKSLWGAAKTEPKDTNWIKSQNSDQLEWAWNYLKEKKRNVPVDNPVSSEEHYTAILASLDCFGKCLSDDPEDHIQSIFSDTSAEKALFLIKFKKAWSQQKFRDSDKAKKLYHLPLTVKAKEALEKLARIKNLNENEVLEELINREYVQIFLDNNGNEKF